MKIVSGKFCCLFISLLLLSAFGACYGKSLKTNELAIDTPLKAAVFYFPSPTIMRCLNHSGIPMNSRKASVYRKIKLKKNHEVEENITIGVSANKKFLFNGNIKDKDEILPIKINGEIPFGIKNRELNFGLFGLENVLGIPGKVQVRDTFGNQKINYETFLKKSKGMIGGLALEIELVGKDLLVDGMTKYFLSGKGNLGKFKIESSATDAGKDVYQVIEKYGPIEINSTVRVFE